MRVLYRSLWAHQITSNGTGRLLVYLRNTTANLEAGHSSLEVHAADILEVHVDPVRGDLAQRLDHVLGAVAELVVDAVVKAEGLADVRAATITINLSKYTHQSQATGAVAVAVAGAGAGAVAR